MKHNSLQPSRKASLGRGERRSTTTNCTTAEPVIAEVIKLGVDTHQNSYSVARMFDNAPPQPSQNMAPETFLEFVKKQKKLAKRADNKGTSHISPAPPSSSASPDGRDRALSTEGPAGHRPAHGGTYPLPQVAHPRGIRSGRSESGHAIGAPLNPSRHGVALRSLRSAGRFGAFPGGCAHPPSAALRLQPEARRSVESNACRAPCSRDWAPAAPI